MAGALRAARNAALRLRIGNDVRGSTDRSVGVAMRRTCTAIATSSAQRNARIVLKDIAFIPKDEITQAIDLLIIAQARRLNMGETIEAEIISRRRAFGF